MAAISKWPHSKRGTPKSHLNAHISKTLEPNLMKLGMLVETNQYYNFMKKNQNRLEAFGGHFEKCCKNDRNSTKFSNFNFSQTTVPILTKPHTIVL